MAPRPRAVFPPAALTKTRRGAAKVGYLTTSAPTLQMAAS
jgi:hypothetical protein